MNLQDKQRLARAPRAAGRWGPGAGSERARPGASENARGAEKRPPNRRPERAPVCADPRRLRISRDKDRGRPRSTVGMQRTWRPCIRGIPSEIVTRPFPPTFRGGYRLSGDVRIVIGVVETPRLLEDTQIAFSSSPAPGSTDSARAGGGCRLSCPPLSGPPNHRKRGVVSPEMHPDQGPKDLAPVTSCSLQSCHGTLLKSPAHPTPPHLLPGWPPHLHGYHQRLARLKLRVLAGSPSASARQLPSTSGSSQPHPQVPSETYQTLAPPEDTRSPAGVGHLLGCGLSRVQPRNLL